MVKRALKRKLKAVQLPAQCLDIIPNYNNRISLQIYTGKLCKAWLLCRVRTSTEVKKDSFEKCNPSTNEKNTNTTKIINAAVSEMCFSLKDSRMHGKIH